MPGSSRSAGCPRSSTSSRGCADAHDYGRRLGRRAQMTPEQWKRAQEIFASAVTRSPGGRAAFVATACGDDEGLRREVETLLAAHEAASSEFLERPAIVGMESVAQAASSRKPLPRGT